MLLLSGGPEGPPVWERFDERLDEPLRILRLTAAKRGVAAAHRDLAAPDHLDDAERFEPGNDGVDVRRLA
jgi:hypothetical protein